MPLTPFAPFAPFDPLLPAIVGASCKPLIPMYGLDRCDPELLGTVVLVLVLELGDEGNELVNAFEFADETGTRNACEPSPDCAFGVEFEGVGVQRPFDPVVPLDPVVRWAPVPSEEVGPRKANDGVTHRFPVVAAPADDVAANNERTEITNRTAAQTRAIING